MICEEKEFVKNMIEKVLLFRWNFSLKKTGEWDMLYDIIVYQTKLCI